MTFGVFEDGEFLETGYATERDAEIAAENMGAGRAVEQCWIHPEEPAGSCFICEEA